MKHQRNYWNNKYASKLSERAPMCYQIYHYFFSHTKSMGDWASVRYQIYCYCHQSEVQILLSLCTGFRGPGQLWVAFTNDIHEGLLRAHHYNSSLAVDQYFALDTIGTVYNKTIKAWLFMYYQIYLYSLAVLSPKLAPLASGLVCYFLVTQPQAGTDKSDNALGTMLSLLHIQHNSIGYI